MPIQSHPPLLENRIFFGKIAGMMMIVSPVRQDKTRQDKTILYLESYTDLWPTLSNPNPNPNPNPPSPLPPYLQSGWKANLRVSCFV